MAAQAAEPDLVLASASAARGQLLRNAGIAFRTHPADIDEDAVRESLQSEDGSVTPADIALILAQAKAAAVSDLVSDTIVIGADQILVCDDEIFNKPADNEEAREQLMRLRGRTHSLISAVACARNGSAEWSFDDTAHLTMRDFSNTFLGTYMALAGNRLLSSVGAYQLEGPGVQLFSHIDGDYFTILGLPLLPLLQYLREQGVIAQ